MLRLRCLLCLVLLHTSNVSRYTIEKNSGFILCCGGVCRGNLIVCQGLDFAADSPSSICHIFLSVTPILLPTLLPRPPPPSPPPLLLLLLLLVLLVLLPPLLLLHSFIHSFIPTEHLY